jgi:hypothetical protein
MLYKLTISSRDKSDIQKALDGVKYLSCLHDIVNAFRDKSKYSGNPDTRWDIAYDLLWQVLREHEIDPLDE